MSNKEKRRFSGRLPAGLLSLIVLAAAPAAAQQACAPPEPGQLDRALEAETVCRAAPGFLRGLGRLLNQAGRYAEAAERLEAALLRDPEDWVVQIEYAIALEGSGDRLAAASLMAALRDNPAVDPAAREEIAAILGRRPHLPVAVLRVAGLALGYDDNLIGGASVGRFELTLPDGRLPVEIAASQRPRGGRVLRAEYRQEGELAAYGQGQWRYAAAGSYRWSADYESASTLHAGLLVERRPTREAGPYALAAYQHLRRDHESLVRLWQALAGWETALEALPGGCRLRPALDLQRLDYPATPQLDGRYRGISVRGACLRDDLLVQIGVGQDRPAHDVRPGGTQDQLSLRLARHFPAGDGAGLTVEFEHSRRADREGYSALLENNARRKLRRNALRMEYRWMYRGGSPYVSFDWFRQDSNLPLFEVENRILMLGVRIAW